MKIYMEPKAVKIELQLSASSLKLNVSVFDIQRLKKIILEHQIVKLPRVEHIMSC